VVSRHRREAYTHHLALKQGRVNIKASREQEIHINDPRLEKCGMALCFYMPMVVEMLQKRFHGFADNFHFDSFEGAHPTGDEPQWATE